MKAPVNKFVFKPATSSGPAAAKPPPSTRERSSPAFGTPKVGSANKTIGKPSLPYATRAKKDTVSIGSVRLGKMAAPKARAKADTLGDEVDALFDGATVSGDAKAAPGRLAPSATTQREIRKLFGEIAAHHAAQLRDFFVELSLSPTSKRWADICAPALTSIRRAASGIAHQELSDALERLERALDDARRGANNIIADTRRDQLLACFAKLTKLLPEAFDLKGHRARRDPIIVHTLLEQVPGMSTLAIDRIYAAGLSSLDAFYGASESDLAATTGVSKELCAVVIEHFAAYRTGRAERAENAEHGAERERLKGLLAELAKTQTEFRDAELQENSKEKRRLRAQRVEQLRNVNLALAHLGQVKLIENIERMPVDAKIERVGRYLRDPARHP